MGLGKKQSVSRNRKVKTKNISGKVSKIRKNIIAASLGTLSNAINQPENIIK